MPTQLDSRWQRFADNVERKLDPHELIALPDIVKNIYPHSPPGWNDEFLSALTAGGEVWEYKISSLAASGSNTPKDGVWR